MLSLQALHGIVLVSPSKRLHAFRSLRELSAFVPHPSQSTAILEALPHSLTSLDISNIEDVFLAVRKRKGPAARHARGQKHAVATWRCLL